MSEQTAHTHSNPFCKCDPCGCGLICTCGLDKDNPVQFDSVWDDDARTLTYTVTFKAKS